MTQKVLNTVIRLIKTKKKVLNILFVSEQDGALIGKGYIWVCNCR